MQNTEDKYNRQQFNVFATIPDYGRVCPLCVDHEHSTEDDCYDCKNVLVVDGVEVAECQCCGPKHGKRPSK